jgi:glucosamine--fructose-6-phosphate aminotransferase (isomerizing)
MVAVLILYALQFGRSRRVSLRQGQEVVQALQNIPEQMKKILEQSSKIQEIASVYQQSKNMVFLGRGIQFPVALEGALKLKEISYIHSEGLAGGEMKHGPIALLSPEFPVVGIMTQNHLYEKMRSNIEEVRARHAPIILIATEGDGEAQRLSEQVVYIPKTLELIEPFLTTIVLQLFAYHMAVILGRDVDRPRNLAKSVTVE